MVQKLGSTSVRPGQDYLINSPAPATRHWGLVEGFTGQYIFNGYLIETSLGGSLYGCTPWLPIGGPLFHTLWVTNHVEVAAGKYISVYPNTNNTYVWHAQGFNTPINPSGDSQWTVTFTANVNDHVSLVATRVAASSMVIPPGSNPNLVVYRTYADDPQTSRYSTITKDVFIGHIAVDGVDDKDAYWRSVVGHEMGHQMADRMFGSRPLNYGLNTAPNLECNCDTVEVAGDRQHCLNSREQVGAARSEAWAHSFSTTLVNTTSDSTAPFGYYKRLYNPLVPGDHILKPPFTHDVGLTFNWMEAYCNQANAGTEMDWLGFFYKLDHKVANSWTINDFWSVFQAECGTPPMQSCAVVTWQSLVTATTAVFQANTPKTNALIMTGDANGVNH